MSPWSHMAAMASAVGLLSWMEIKPDGDLAVILLCVAACGMSIEQLYAARPIRRTPQPLLLPPPGPCSRPGYHYALHVWLGPVHYCMHCKRPIIAKAAP